MLRIYLRETEEKQSDAAHKLLNEIFDHQFQLINPVLQIGERGKPSIPGGPEFNLSHTNGAVVAAISDHPVGVDVERVRKYHDSLPERIFSKPELAWFRGRGECKVDFFRLWTLKESYYKFLGTGLPGFPNETEFIFDGAWKLRGADCCFQTFDYKNMVITVCSDDHNRAELIVL